MKCMECGRVVKGVHRAYPQCMKCANRKGKTGGFTNRGHAGGKNEKPKDAAEPTQELPGTTEKLRVMAERAARGEEVIHPKDARPQKDW